MVLRIIIHQLTDPPPGLDPDRMAEGRIRNARLREIGTRSLIAATTAANATGLIAQSITFAYAPGTQPYREEAPFDPSATAVATLERQVLQAPLLGIVLRFGRIYGPGTAIECSADGLEVHVDAAAAATPCAISLGQRSIYSVVEADGGVDSRKAVSSLLWQSHFRSP